MCMWLVSVGIPQVLGSRELSLVLLCVSREMPSGVLSEEVSEVSQAMARCCSRVTGHALAEGPARKPPVPRWWQTCPQVYALEEPCRTSQETGMRYRLLCVSVG